MIPIATVLEVVKTLVPVGRGFLQLVVLLAELSPTMVKLWREYQKANGRLSATDRKRLTDTVKQAVKSKDTADLEDFLTGRKYRGENID